MMMTTTPFIYCADDVSDTTTASDVVGSYVSVGATAVVESNDPPSTYVQTYERAASCNLEPVVPPTRRRAPRGKCRAHGRLHCTSPACRGAA